MPTTGTVNTRLMVIKVGTVTITCLTDASLSMTVETRDTTCKDTASWTAALSGKRSWEISGGAFFAYDAAYGAVALFDLFNSDQATLAVVKWGTTVVGDISFSGTALLTSLSFSAPGTDENTTLEFTFMGVGPLAKSTNV